MFSSYWDSVQDQFEEDDVMRWAATLSRARVTRWFLENFSFNLHWNPISFLFRWGGMISTPDAVLQAMIKRSLQESGCPVHIVTELMENAHERRWPPGLQTLETRQMNRRWNFCVYLLFPHENPNFQIHDIETDPYLLQAIWAIHSSEDSRKAGGGGDGLWQHTH